MKRHFGAAAAIACALAVAAPAAAMAHDAGGGDQLRPGNLLVSGSTYREADIQPGVTQLPPGCAAANCDQGADPNQLVAINDNPSATAPTAGESFHTVMAPRYGRVVRGVSLTPGGLDGHHGDVRTGRDRAHGRARRSAR